jgi:hypothetical protein
MAPPTATETLVETISQVPTIVPILAETQDVEAPPKVEAPPRVDSPIELADPVAAEKSAETAQDQVQEEPAPAPVEFEKPTEATQDVVKEEAAPDHVEAEKQAETVQEPVKEEAAPGAEKPKVRRIIDEEGGTTTATVRATT